LRDRFSINIFESVDYSIDRLLVKSSIATLNQLYR
jgi:hypothetical protein